MSLRPCAPSRRASAATSSGNCAVPSPTTSRRGWKAGSQPAEAETAVLTELGDPARLAAQYSGRPLYLIGPDLFLDWWRLLKTLAIIITPLSFVGSVVVRMALEPGEPAGAFGAAIGTAISVLVHLGFWVTLVFAIIQFNGTRRKDLGLQPWSPAMLPQVPRKSQVSLGDTIATVVLVAFFIGVLLWQRIGSLLYLNGEPVVVLQEDLWSFWLPYVIVLLVIEAGFAVVLYLAGRWTYAFAVVNTVLALAFMVPVLWLLSTDQVFDWSFPGERRLGCGRIHLDRGNHRRSGPVHRPVGHRGRFPQGLQGRNVRCRLPAAVR